MTFKNFTKKNSSVNRISSTEDILNSSSSYIHCVPWFYCAEVIISVEFVRVSVQHISFWAAEARKFILSTHIHLYII